MSLPPDNHVHSEWSWDADHGSMVDTCARAVELGLPSVAFTEHLDHTAWTVLSLAGKAATPGRVRDGVLTPTPLDVDGYLACVEACRERFPGLRILTGAELGEPHWHRSAVGPLLARGSFERVLASVHSGVGQAGPSEVDQLYPGRDPSAVLRAHLAETLRLVETFEDYQVLAHVDYGVRSWPATTPYDVTAFADDFRAVLRALARREKVLELNTRVPLDPQILRWWRAEGGGAISFASDAHVPDALAAGFAEAVRVATAAGFRPGRDLVDFWIRS